MPPPYNHPARVAERIATLDLVSAGRVEWGTGESASLAELGGFGVSVQDKQPMWHEATREAANMMVMDPYPGYQGKYFSMPCRNVVPKPVQKPHPPILIGGDGATTFDRVVEFGDGWMPIIRPNKNPVERIPELRERLKKAGRDPKTAPVSIFFAPPKKEGLDRLASAGVERAIFGVPSEGRESVLPRLDAFAKLIS